MGSVCLENPRVNETSVNLAGYVVCATNTELHLRGCEIYLSEEMQLSRAEPRTVLTSDKIHPPEDNKN